MSKGTSLVVGNCKATLATDIGIGHKIAIEPIARGAAIRKFGEVIGFATADIATGELIYSHNLANGETVSEYERGTVHPPCHRCRPRWATARLWVIAGPMAAWERAITSASS